MAQEDGGLEPAPCRGGVLAGKDMDGVGQEGTSPSYAPEFLTGSLTRDRLAQGKLAGVVNGALLRT